MSWNAAKRVASASAFFLVVAGLATARPVADCNRARSATERAICIDPRLAAADAEMAKAYSALRALSPTAQHAALLDSQREWIAQCDGACQDTGSVLTQCLLEQTRARRRFLAGRRPERGPRRVTAVAGVPSRIGRPLQNLDRISANPESR